MTQPISNRYMKSKTFVDIHKSSKSQRTATWHGFVARESSERCGFLTKSLQTRWQVHRRRDTRCLWCDGCQRFRDTHCHHWPESGGSVPNCSHDGTPLCLKHLSHHWFRASLSNTLKPASLLTLFGRYSQKLLKRKSSARPACSTQVPWTGEPRYYTASSLSVTAHAAQTLPSCRHTRVHCIANSAHMVTYCQWHHFTNHLTGTATSAPTN